METRCQSLKHEAWQVCPTLCHLGPWPSGLRVSETEDDRPLSPKQPTYVVVLQSLKQGLPRCPWVAAGISGGTDPAGSPCLHPQGGRRPGPASA